MDNQLQKWREASICTPRGWRFFYFGEPLECVPYVLYQCPYPDDVVNGPPWTLDTEGERVYSEMNFADWWWETLDRPSLGATIVQLICGSDETQFTEFSGDLIAWPIYLTIRNIHSSIRNKYSYLMQFV
jgi:hypothetical protein